MASSARRTCGRGRAWRIFDIDADGRAAAHRTPKKSHDPARAREQVSRRLIDAIENGSIELHCAMGSALDSPRAWNVSLGMGAEELEQQCVVGFDPCLRKAM